MAVLPTPSAKRTFVEAKLRSLLDSKASATVMMLIIGAVTSKSKRRNTWVGVILEAVLVKTVPSGRRCRKASRVSFRVIAAIVERGEDSSERRRL